MSAGRAVGLLVGLLAVGCDARPNAEAEEPPDYLYVGAATGGLFKSINNGTTWTPVFDDQGSYSIGAVTLDPKNPNVVWVGTGELNAQRSVGYGDGVYKSENSGRSWKNSLPCARSRKGKFCIGSPSPCVCPRANPPM